MVKTGWRAIWAYLRGERGVLSMRRKSPGLEGRITFLDADVLDALVSDPEALPFVLRELENERRRQRVKAVPDPSDPPE